MNDIYDKVLEALVREMGIVGGVATPLGTGPKAGGQGENIYKSPDSTDKKHRSKGKSKKTYTRSVQWYLKNGGEKGRKRSLKEIHSAFFGKRLTEARTARIADLRKSEIIAYLNFLKGKVDENINFSVTEKIAGQAMTVGIRGGSRGNMIYCATKDMLIQQGGDIFHPRFAKSKGTSRLVKKAFIQRFRKLQPGEEIVLNMEIVIDDKSKPDYIAYHVPKEKTYAAIFSIKPDGAFTKTDANKMSGNYWSRRHRANSVLEVLLPEDIPLNPIVSIDDAIIEEIDDLIIAVESAPSSPGKDPDFPRKSFVKSEISPRIRSLVKSIFPSSNINADSPIEGLAVNMSSGEESTFFKVPSEDFDRLQSIQASVYAEFKTNSRGSNESRAEGFISQLENPVTKQSFARNVFKLIKHLNDVGTLPLNYRTFFSPRKFKQFCSMMLTGLQNKDTQTIANAIWLISTRLYTSKGKESFTSTESQQLVQFIEQNNLI